MTKDTKMKKVAVALSGGVDSSVAAAFLKNQGYEVVGVHLICYDEKVSYCRAKKDREDAVRVATVLDIPIRILDYREEYKRKVIDSFVAEYARNRTPNPDVLCNKEIKFGMLLDNVLQEIKADYLATGHYARISKDGGLLKGVDPKKDQSYFLYTLKRDQLKNILFPVGGLHKNKVRDRAKTFALPTATKKDSQGICFMGRVNISEFLKEKIKVPHGLVVDVEGNIIGEHQGLPFYTIGQRHGFTVTRYVGEPLYVIDKDAHSNTLVVGRRSELIVRAFEVSDVTWIEDVHLPMRCQVRIRHLGHLMKCRLIKTDISGQLSVILEHDACGVSPGQAAVFYDDERVLGGGIIGTFQLSQNTSNLRLHTRVLGSSIGTGS